MFILHKTKKCVQQKIQQQTNQLCTNVKVNKHTVTNEIIQRIHKNSNLIENKHKQQ
jgi:hypothetical protein